MKYYRIILTGIMIHFLPLSAESIQEPSTSPALQEASLTSLDEELSLLDEEFEEFKEELSSIAEAIQTNDRSLSTLSENSSPVETSDNFVSSSEPVNALLNQMSENQQDAIPTVESFAEAKVEEATPSEAQPGMMAITSEPVVDQEQPLFSFKEVKQQDAPATLYKVGTSMVGEPSALNRDAVAIDLQKAFSGAPLIYTLLLAMSVFSVFIWMYALLSVRSAARVSPNLLRNLQNKLNSNHFDEVLSICKHHNDLLCKMVLSGIHARRHGLPMMIEAMKTEGKRSTVGFWQKIGLLNDVAIIAPMLGLLGTVLGMFYAFYDVNRSIESVSSLFDGLGVSVGTTVAGLVVAILALILHSTAKFRIVRALAKVENEAQSLATLIEDRTSIL